MPKKNNPGCSCCGETPILDCPGELDGGSPMCDNDAPSQFQIDIGTVTNDDCSDCVSMLSGQSFVVDRDADGSTCRWQYVFGFAQICLASPSTRIFLSFGPDGFTERVIEVEIQVIGTGNGPFAGIKWRRIHTIGELPLSCGDLSAYDIPFFSHGGSPDQPCGGTPTCTITAL